MVEYKPDFSKHIEHCMSLEELHPLKGEGPVAYAERMALFEPGTRVVAALMGHFGLTHEEAKVLYLSNPAPHESCCRERIAVARARGWSANRDKQKLAEQYKLTPQLASQVYDYLAAPPVEGAPNLFMEIVTRRVVAESKLSEDAQERLRLLLAKNSAAF